MSAAPDTVAATPRSPRKRLLLIAALVFLIAAAAYGAWWFLIARHFQSTDDAYVQGDLVQITPQIAGTITGLHADDTDFVQAGQTLVELDRADVEVALAEAESQLAQTVRQVSTLYVQNDGFDAQIRARQADAASAKAALARAQADLRRRQALAQSGGVSGEEILHARTTVETAQAALAAAEAAVANAKAGLAGNETLTAGTDVQDHPNVRLAAARVRQAYLDLARTEIQAPVSGYVARRSGQLGQRVAAGTALMAVVPLDQVWVDANFKEVQIGSMRIGQPATLHADMYGSKVAYRGKVAGLGAGTGSAFALLPAQNASGNWIKVVQRVPVRIELDPEELREHPLLLGLSMNVEVDISDTSGPALSAGRRKDSSYAVNVLSDAQAQARGVIERIIATHLGAGGAPAPAPVAQQPHTRLAVTRNGG
ncbi:HlyD family efflux transporter periplasmic adaptor subunit [Verticiella sediminum]|uniref:HlyD family efflux transporter periplasmic adaptor subunit n=1 Tax=Verticiella sediminum TaxID=1247510 RepID=A0A556AJ20_9BURK|nr:HlyD family efflux transporter periplasmic adaptor subunit [Verticiella sediminum]TSH92871.1 HlyD family efflux transporter periplasmic adaptor subunit [Verticiella sediminum]